MPKLEDLLAASKHHDDLAAQVTKQQIETIAAGMKKASIEPTPGLHPSKLMLVDEDDDPFGGNVNNRNVAARIADAGKRLYTNHSRPIHTGDPEKARIDIAKSRRLNPDTPVDDSDAEETVSKPMPTPGSPAAKKAAGLSAVPPGAESVTAPSLNAPPTWKPGS